MATIKPGQVLTRMTGRRKPKSPVGDNFAADVRPVNQQEAHERQEAEREAARDVHDWRTLGKKY